jgi:hypothetical protein
MSARIDPPRRYPCLARLAFRYTRHIGGTVVGRRSGLPRISPVALMALLADVLVDPALAASRHLVFELHAQPGGWR